MNLEQTMAGITIGEPSVYGGLAVFPLIGDAARKRDYVTLSEAFRKKGVQISEISEGGSVPELKLKNLLNTDLFVADGEALVGAKQNRVLNVSIYVKAGDEVVIPVSCVERGRWSYRQRDFLAGEHSEFISSRAAKMASVDASLRRTGTDRRSDQGAVWAEMRAKRTYFQAEAPTESMDDVYKTARPSLDQYLNHIRMQPNQVGLACAIDGKTVGMELFEHTSVLEQFFHKLVRAYAAEVVHEERVTTTNPDREELDHLLRQISKARASKYEAVGSGTELRFLVGSLNGSALDVDGNLLHLVALSNRRRHGF